MVVPVIVRLWLGQARHRAAIRNFLGLRQEDHTFQVWLGYRVYSRPACILARACLKKENGGSDGDIVQ